jgi:hypothetical protein
MRTTVDDPMFFPLATYWLPVAWCHRLAVGLSSK